MENVEFEEKVDLDSLVLPSNPMKLAKIEINNFKQEPIEKEKQQVVFESDHDVGKEFKLKMEENILKLCEELDKEKSENSATDFKLTRLIRIRKFVENIHWKNLMKSNLFHTNFVTSPSFKSMK